MIKSFMKGQDEWDLHLSCLAAAYRSTVHESTGLTPNMLVLGREVRLPTELVVDVPKAEVASYGEYTSNLRSVMQHAHTVARQHLIASSERQQGTYDVKGCYHKYDCGDLVWYASTIDQLHITPKLRSPFQGPCLVIKKLGGSNFLIQCDSQGKQKVVHHDRLKPYLGKLRPRWVHTAMHKL